MVDDSDAPTPPNLPQVICYFRSLPTLPYLTTKKRLCKLLYHRALQNEADETRTLNLRFDSPVLYGAKSAGRDLALSAVQNAGKSG